MSEIGNKPIQQSISVPVCQETIFENVFKLVESNTNYFDSQENNLLKRISFCYKPISVHSKFFIEFYVKESGANSAKISFTISQTDGQLTDVAHGIATKIKEELLDYLNDIIQSGSVNPEKFINAKNKYKGTKNLLAFTLVLFAAALIFIIYLINKS